MSEQMRKEFEAWAKAKGVAIDFGGFRINEYNNIFAQMYWEGWQASRAAIVVELPDWSEYDTPRQAIDACGQSLTEAGFGVSYK
jgi:hypothetical protein